MPANTEISRKIRRQAAFRLWMANLVLAVIVGVNYLVHVPEVDRGSVKMWFFALPALLSTGLMLTLVPGALFTFLAGRVRSVRVYGLVQAGFWTVFLVLLFTDTRIYNMFRYHLNGQVLNLVYVRGSEDAIHLGWQVWTAVTLGLAGGIILQLGLWTWSLRRAVDHARLRFASTRFLRPSLAWMMVLVSAVVIEKSIYAEADLTRDRQLTHLARIFPLYARVPLEGLANQVLGVAPGPRVELEGFRLDYPHALPAVDPDGPRPNVLIVIIDCLRQDRLRPEYTPNVSRWAEESRRFDDHVSGGNSTRFGIFSLLYSLHGSYWFPVLAERHAPVLITTLDELGYEFGIFGSASMGYPELRDTAWSTIPDRVFDDFPAPEPWRRDEQAADAMIAWLESIEGEQTPFFGLLLLDSPHQTYSHPPDATPFTPSAPEIDYMAMTRNEGPLPEVLEAVRNRYNNAVHHADAVAGRVLDTIRRSSRFEDTVVVITGDHGEEFLECGFFGHTSAYTPQQVAVPFVMRGPGIEPGVEYRATSHMDLAPTLLEMLGANPSGRRAWCQGANLFDPPVDRRRVMGGWNELGVWTPQGILRVPLSLFEFNIEVYDYDWNLIADDHEVLQAEAETLERLGAACNRFLR